MRVVIIGNKKDDAINLSEFTDIVRKRFIDYKTCGDINVKMLENINKLELNYDIYMLIVNNIEELLQYNKMIKEANKVLILTKNTNANFIMSCINYTKNLLYLYVDISIILKKVISMYFENNKLS